MRLLKLALGMVFVAFVMSSGVAYAQAMITGVPSSPTAPVSIESSICVPACTQ
jgi:hypothetical protein